MMMKNKTLIAVIVVSIFGIALIGCLRENLNSGNIDQGNFPNIKVAIVYESDGDPNDRIRDANSIANLVAETKADFIHRAYFRGRVMAVYEKKYEVYGILEDSIETIKMKNPNVLIGGAIAAHEINRVEYDPLTREVIPESKTWGEMALDPQKYGFNMTKEKLHEICWEEAGTEDFILPDIINTDFQKLLLDFAKKQIDCGVDAIWIDVLYVQAQIFSRLAKEEGKDRINNPAIEASVEAASHIVDEIHKYGRSKGKEIYVGSWSYEEQYKYGFPKDSYPKFDFVTMSPSVEEVKNKRLNEEEWKEKIRLTKEIYGQEIPIIAFIDWSFTRDTPLGVFSQTLTKEEANEALRNFDKFFTENGIIFAYPVHGGFMGRDATILAFGKSYKYDSLAPEFQTYETIKELAQEKAKNENGGLAGMWFVTAHPNAQQSLALRISPERYTPLPFI